MSKPLVFFNHCNNGDIHLPRTMVRHLVRKSGFDKAYYTHKNPPRLLADMPEIVFQPETIGRLDKNAGLIEDDACYFLNTWVGAFNQSFTGDGCTIQSIYLIFNKYCQYLFNEDMPPLTDMIPDIDFSKFGKTELLEKHFAHRKGQKAVFISNGYVWSGQAENFDMLPVIDQVSRLNPSYDFYLTNRNALPRLEGSNVFYTEDVLQSHNTCDLNENAHLSTYCEKIIGRSSGPFSFALNKANLTRNVDIIAVKSYAGFNGFNNIAGFNAQFINAQTIEELFQ